MADNENNDDTTASLHGSLGSWLLVGGLLLMTEENLRSIEENVDDFVIHLALFITFVAVVTAIAATR